MVIHLTQGRPIISRDSQNRQQTSRLCIAEHLEDTFNRPRTLSSQGTPTAEHIRPKTNPLSKITIGVLIASLLASYPEGGQKYFQGVFGSGVSQVLLSLIFILMQLHEQLHSTSRIKSSSRNQEPQYVVHRQLFSIFTQRNATVSQQLL